MFCPAALLGSAELETALQLAVACVGASDLERESARAVLVFLGQLAGRCGGQLDRYQGEVEAALAPHGEALTRLMFAALAVREGGGAFLETGGGSREAEMGDDGFRLEEAVRDGGVEIVCLIGNR